MATEDISEVFETTGKNQHCCWQVWGTSDTHNISVYDAAR